MHLTSLRYFVTIAEYLNFTKASERLFISQPTLSRQMMDLEAELGCPLFIRVRRGLLLTEEGEILLKEAKKILQLCDELPQKVRPSSPKRSTESLRVGFQGYLNIDPLEQAMMSLGKEGHVIAFTPYRGASSELVDMLAKDEIDVAYLVYSCVVNMKDVEAIRVLENRLQIAVPSNHPLADRERVSLRELKDEYFILLERKKSPATLDYSVGQCLKNGFSPRVSEYVADIETAMIFVSMGRGVTFVNSQRKLVVPDTVRVLEVENDPDDHNIDTVIAFKRANENPALPLFVSEIQRGTA